MSDPVTNIEIEDVLSSIRRLVSSEERPKTSGNAQAAPAAGERLVLTPSLRVGLAQDPHLPESGANAVAEDDPDDDDDWHADAGHDWRNDEPDGAAEDEAADVPAADGRPARKDDTLVMTDDMNGGDTSGDQAAADTDTDARPQRAAALKARVAELEDVVSRQRDQWDPDGASDDANSAKPVAPLPWEDDATDDADAAQADDDADDDSDEAPSAARHRTVTPPPVTPKATAASDSVAEKDDDDIPENFVAHEATEDAPDDMDFMAGSDEFLDEETLRDLVADIVRQELQGALGERITRNVRKLVRREIHRALTSQEFE